MSRFSLGHYTTKIDVRVSAASLPVMSVIAPGHALAWLGCGLIMDNSLSERCALLAKR
jgi:hypothetical protein